MNLQNEIIELEKTLKEKKYMLDKEKAEKKRLERAEKYFENNFNYNKIDRFENYYYTIKDNFLKCYSEDIEYNKYEMIQANEKFKEDIRNELDEILRIYNSIVEDDEELSLETNKENK